MKIFSYEYLNQLIAEHKLVSASIIHISNKYRKISQKDDTPAISTAVSNLYSEKLQLEAKIDIISDYLKIK